MTILRICTAVAIAVLMAISPPAAGNALAAGDAVDDAYVVAEDGTLAVPAAETPDLLDNDTADPGATLCVTGFDATGLEGALDPAPDEFGAFTYTPAANWHGSTSFTYGIAVVVDGSCPDVVEDTATVTITVSPVNDAPTAGADSFVAIRDRTLNVSAPGVLRNDSDVDGDSLSAVKVSNPAHGVVTLAADGAFSYTPTAGYQGPDAFSYRASDGSENSPTRVVTLNVTAIPTPIPTAPPPTPAPTATPQPTPEPSPSGSAEPSSSIEPSPSASAATPSDGASPTPSASADPDPSAGSGGLSLPAIVLALVLISLLAFGAAIYVPKWLERRRGGVPIDDAYRDDGPD